MNEKLYYKINEVAKMIGVSSSTIRFWEQKIPFLRPQIRSRVRHYNRENIELLKTIYKLIKQEKYTIEGAKLHVLKKINEPNKWINDLISFKKMLIKIKKNIVMK